MKNYVLTALIALTCQVAIAQTHVSGEQGGATWTKANSPYILDGSITVSQGQALTIQSGVEVQSHNYTDVINVYGTLIAKGTATDSIRFIGFANPFVNQNSTHGGSIQFQSSSVNSVIDYAVVDSMGDADYYGEAIGIRTTSFSITNSNIRNSDATGIHVSNSDISPIISQSIFYSNPKDIEAIVSGVGGITNCKNAKVYLANSSIDLESQIPKPGMNSYYILEGGFTVSQGQTLTIQPGVEIQSHSYTDAINVYGTLVAKGTVSDSIRFTGFANFAVNQYSTSGGSIQFQTTSVNSSLQYTVVDRMGDADYYGDAIGVSTGSLSITNSSIRNNDAIGINITSAGISPIISGVTFLNNPKPINVYPSSAGGISNCTNAYIYISNGSIDITSQINKPGSNSYYILSGGFTVSQGKTLTIQAGVEIQSHSYTDVIEVYGTLMAKGTASDLIKFTGFANPSVNQYSTSGGSIQFESSSINSALQYTAFDKMGDADYYGVAIGIYTASVSITNSSIRNSDATGININAPGISPIISQNTFSNNPKDIEVNPDACSGIISNSNAKIYIRSGSISSNTSWTFPGSSSYYVLEGSVTISNTYTLTIEAGNLIYFSDYGTLQTYGTLRAIGTQTTPIQFLKLINSSASSYAYIDLESSSSNSVLKYINIDKLGGSGTASLYIETSSFSLSNITVSNSGGYGLYVSNIGSTQLSSLNLVNNQIGLFVAGGPAKITNSNIYGNTSYGVYNQASDTTDARYCYWGDASGPYNVSVNASGRGNQVSDRVTFNPWNPQPQNGVVSDIGVSSVLAPITDCNLTSADTVKVRVNNYGNINQTGFKVSYKINNGNPVTETVNSSVLTGNSIDYTFAQTANLAAIGTYQITAYTTLATDSVKTNDTATTSIQHLANISAPASLLPANNSSNLNIPVTLSWSAVEGATGYDVYVWKATDAEPSVPIVSNLTQISFTLSQPTIVFGTTYKWQVVAKRSSCIAASAIQSFSTKVLPDLVIDSISVPKTATSESDITINYRIKNQGNGSTQTAWSDVFYFSNVPEVDGNINKTTISYKNNFSALNPNQSYTSSNITFHIPIGYQGTYYVLGTTDATNSVPEVTDTNNNKISIPITVTLAPPPDLQVISVVANPTTAFSEDSVTITYTVKNLGTGPTSVAQWNDKIFISNSNTFDISNSTLLATTVRSQSLAVNGQYTVSTKIKLPSRIGGSYYLYVYTDALNNVFENLREDNNTTNTAITVIERPTPNLVVNNISLSTDTAVNSQAINFQWVTKNEGAVTALPSWIESVYLSYDSTFDLNDIFIGSISRNDSIKSLQTNGSQASLQLPAKLPTGKCYVFVVTDASNIIYEGSVGETDNISRYNGSLFIVNPDLLPTTFTVPSTATSDQTFTVNWKVTDNSTKAGIYNSAWVDRIYLSKDNSFDRNQDTLLSFSIINQLLAPSASYTKQATVTLPTGISGSYYLILVSDADTSILESNESNNNVAMPLTVTLAPWADLQVTSISAPVTDTAGTQLSLSYTIKNSGTGSIINKTWIDYIYLSSSTDVNNSNVVYLSSISNSLSLSANQSYTNNLSVKIPDTLSAGQYYVLVVTDANNNIFENTGESNNRKVSNSINIASVPPTDLSVVGGQVLSAAVAAGKPVNLQWTVKNNSNHATIVSSWQDAVYLSSNPVLDASDKLLQSFTKTGPITANSTYTQSQTVIIPNDASGILYLIVETDENNTNNDPNPGNNYLAIGNGDSSNQINVIPIVPPDLTPLTLNAPQQSYAAQPIKASYTVKNSGNGATSSGFWTDNFYLSTDYQLDSKDILVGSVSQYSPLAAGAQYTDTVQLTIPPDITGNYILILKTNSGNSVYEAGQTDNNLAFSNLEVLPQLPSDLYIDSVIVPTASQIAGSSNTTISWLLSNIGANNANGYLREAVYLSADTTWDANDVLLGSLEDSIKLPSLISVNRQLTSTLTNISAGSYYVIVRTDILNNIVESNEANNTQVSLTKLNVTVKELLLNTVTPDTLVNNLPLYYRLEIPASLIGETISVQLTGDIIHNASNRLFVKYGQVPATNKYDYIAVVSFKANQQVILPEVKAGTYYIMATGSDTAMDKQQATLFAKDIPFSITSVETNQGGNTGAVTLKISGARFEQEMTIQLTGVDTITAQNITFIDETTVFATFDLTGQPLGTYTVKVINSKNNIAQLVNGFSIVTGSPGGTGLTGTGFTCKITNIGFENNLLVGDSHPTYVRPGTTGAITIFFQNAGNVDIPVQHRILTSPDGIYMNFTTDYSQKLTELLLDFKEQGGPPDVIRPGASGFVTVYALIVGDHYTPDIYFLLSE